MIAKTVNGASQMLNCSQPGLSRALKHMESKIGFPLFDRAHGRLFPTQEAILLLEEVQHLYKNVEQVNLVLSRLAAGENRIFRLGAPPSVGHSMVPLIQRELRKQFEALTIHVDILPIEQVIDYLVFQRGEFALTVFHVDHPNIVSKVIGEGRMVCVVSKSHRLAGKSRISLKEIAHEKLISYQGDTPHSQIIQGMYAKAKIKYEVFTYVRFAETALTFVEQDLGVAIVDEFTTMNRTFEGIRVLPLEQTGVLPVYLNRGRFMPRSTVSEAFEVITMGAFETFRH
jgi:DNA-binding transcriptional LysR family regulator